LCAALDVDTFATEHLQGSEDYRHKPMRWVVESWSQKGHGTFLTGAASREHAESDVAGANVSEGWVPVALYDLDDLAGDEPPIDEGDRIRLGTGTFEVTGTDEKDGAPTLDFWEGENARWCYADDAELIERAEPDERLPERYPVARCAVFVAFNSTPEG
jgi:hypothetical protein